jgi:carnitine-CoA ligase
MTVKGLLEKRAEKNGEKAFVFFKDQEVTFSVMNQMANRFAHGLQSMGVKKGEKVCLLLPNGLEFLYLWFGLAKMGGIMVPLNFNRPGAELGYMIRHCDARWVVVDEDLYPAYVSAGKDLPRIEQKVWRGEKDPPSKDFRPLGDLLRGAERGDPAEEIREEDPLGILYTPAITAPPKGIMISHFNYVNTGEQWAKGVIDSREEDVFFTHLPLFGANAQMFTIMGSLAMGCSLVLREKFSPFHFWEDIQRWRVTIFSYTSEMLQMLLKQPVRDDIGHPVRAVFGGIVPRELRQEFEKRFRIKALEGCGWIESGGLNVVSLANDKKAGSLGKPVRFCEVMIWDENNQEVPIGQTGEIVIKGNPRYSMSLGYYKQLDRTAEAWDGGAFHTGDWGYKDADGYLYLADPVDKGIRRIGENIFP